MRPVKWIASTVGYVLNSDGYSRGNPGISGGGGLVHDWNGNFMFGYSCFFGSLTSLLAELKAMAFRVQQCLSRGFLDCILNRILLF